MAELIDHKVLAISRLATQFRESPNLIAYIQTLLLEADNLEAVLQDLLTERTLENARGVQLDIIGELVGQPREIVDASVFTYFGFMGEPQSESFGTLIDPGIGGRFAEFNSPTTGSRVLSDTEYRQFIEARITKNSTTATPEDIIAAFKFLFGQDTLVLLQEGVEAQYNISIGRLLTSSEKALLGADIFPKPAGVQVSYVSEFESDMVMGFLGIPGALGFADENIPDSGGFFGKLI